MKILGKRLNRKADNADPVLSELHLVAFQDLVKSFIEHSALEFSLKDF